jgi:uncharacterized protein DUF4112
MAEHSLARVRHFAEFLDSGVPLPFTSFRIGLDPILGLVPGLGDTAGALLAGWILIEAARLGASRATLVRMAGNIALDATIGAIPVVGDLFDFVWKSNLRNVALLERSQLDPAGARSSDRRVVVALVGGIAVLGAGLVAGGAWLVAHLLRAMLS